MNFRHSIGLAALTGIFVLYGCGQTEMKAEKMSEKTTPASAEANAGEAQATNPLLAPHSPEMTQKAPESYKARFETSKGVFVIQVTRSWSPNGADRFYALVKHGFFNECRFFRVIAKFMVQFGINGDPQVSSFWRQAPIDDDPVKATNDRGYITFAKTNAPNSRTTQVFINFKSNANLDAMGFSPFGKVIEGMEVVDSINSAYGEGAPSGRGPSQAMIQEKGNTYLKAAFADLDYIKKATIVEPK